MYRINNANPDESLEAVGHTVCDHFVAFSNLASQDLIHAIGIQQTEVTVRRASFEDVSTLTQLRLSSLREMGALAKDADLPALTHAISSFFERKIPNGEFVAWVADNGENIIATAGLVFFERLPVADCLFGMDAYVMNVYTTPEWRGQGISTMLMSELTHFASNAGVSRIRLHTSTRARKLYEGLGFMPKITEMELVL